MLLIEAPLGSGKTTALLRFCADAGEHILIRLQHVPPNPPKIWDSIIASLGDRYPDVAVFLRALGYPDDEMRLALLENYLRERHRSQPLFIVFDDYPALSLLSMDRLLESLAHTKMFHVIVSGEDLSYLPADLWVEEGLARWMPAAAFLFSSTDVYEYFQQAGIAITETRANTIQRRTGGNACAVAMMLCHYRRMQALGKWDSLEAMALGIAFQPLRDNLKLVLYHMAYLPICTSEQIIYITGLPDAATRLERISKKTDLVDWDGQHWRVHPLLVEVLHQELQPASASMNERLGDVFRAEGRWEEALEQYRRALHTEAIAVTLESIPYADLQRLDFDWMATFFLALPIELLLEHSLGLIRFLCANAIVQPQKARRLFTTMEDRLGTFPLSPETAPYCAFLRFWNAVPDLEAMARYAQQATPLPGFPVLPSMDGVFGWRSLLFLFHCEKGSLRERCELGATGLKGFMPAAEGWANLFRAEYHLVTGDLANAASLAGTAMLEALATHNWYVALTAAFVQTRSRILTGTENYSIAALEQVAKQIDAEACTPGEYGALLSLTRIYSCYLLALKDRISDIPDWFFRFLSAETLDYRTDFMQLVRLRYLLVGQQYRRLEEECKVLHKRFVSLHSLMGQLYVLLYNAIAIYNQRSSASGCNALDRVLSFARADQIVLPFLELADDVLPLLYEQQSRDATDPYLGMLVQRCCELVSDPLHKLTKPELAVLRLYGKRHTPLEIAENLLIPPTDVASLCASIVGKLSVTDMHQAVLYYVHP